MNIVLNVVILEDISTDAERLNQLLIEYSNANQIEIRTQHYVSGASYFTSNKDFKEKFPDLYMMDIQLGSMNGIDVSKQLRMNGYKGPILIMTAFKEYVFEGYDVRAMNYLLKPLKKESLYKCLNEVISELHSDVYLLRTKQEIKRIPYADIIVFSSSMHSIDILTTDSNYHQYISLNEVAIHLPSQFIRTHRSYIVNMAHMDKIVSNTITLSNGMTVPIARSFLQTVTESYLNYSTRYDYHLVDRRRN